MIGEPYWLVFNTAPTVDWIPYELRMKNGTSHTIKFGQAYDFEANNVRLEYAHMLSIDASGG